MEQVVRVRRLLPEGMAEVILVRQSACSGNCHQCSGCGAAQEKLILQAHNYINAQPGDVVTIVSDSAPVLKAAAVLYLLPLALFFAGYLLGHRLWGSGMLASVVAFFGGLIPIVWYDRRLKKKRIVYRITAFAGENNC